MKRSMEESNVWWAPYKPVHQLACSPVYLSSPSFVVLVQLLYLESGGGGGGIVYNLCVDGVFLGFYFQ